MKPKEPDAVAAAPPFPDLLDYLWAFFIEISLGILNNGMAPAQIGWRDLIDWCALTGNVLEPWEARALVMLGRLRANVESEKYSEPKTTMAK